ncbi:DUF3231 family protein [Halobacillus seohaensis]|uniref:DUF3231 family protein n=1 Tax=Halobacillus seohaensis TaxID=447421 RepID=A0ABW2EFR9_9BACI
MKDLTAAEIHNLMTSYMTNTMASVVTADVLKKAEDPGVREMLELGLQIANKEVEGAEYFLTSDNRPLPEPFTKRDIQLPNTKYFSDNFVVLLKYKLGQDALNVYALSLSSSINPEVCTFYKKLMNETADLVEKCIGLIINSGMHQPLIHIPRDTGLDKVEDQDFLWNSIGGNRPLSAPEVLQITSNYYSTEVLREIFRSFSKTKNKELKNHFERGKKLCAKQLEAMQGKLEKDELPQLPTWESEVDTEGEAPFSERLMLFKTSMMAGAAGGRFGTSASATLRKDIGTTFLKLMAETLLFAEDTGNILIKYRMLDEPPLVRKRQ